MTPEYDTTVWLPEKFQTAQGWRAFAHRVGDDGRYPGIIEGVGDTSEEAAASLPGRIQEVTAQMCLCDCCGHQGTITR